MRVWPRLLLLLPLMACTPREMPAGPSVEAPRLEADAIVTADGAQLPLRRWAPEGEPRFVILALHGLNDYSGNFMNESAPLLTKGGALVYAYDQRGFGGAPNRSFWPGAETMASDALAAGRLIRAQNPGLPILLMGESMGGALALWLDGSVPDMPFDGIIATTPALWAREFMPEWMRGLLWFGAHTLPQWGFYAYSPGIVASSNEDALRRFGTDPLTLKTTRIDMSWGIVSLMDRAVAAAPQCCEVPTLVLTGKRDGVVPRQAVQATLARIPKDAPYERIDYDQGWHLLLRDQIRAKVATDILAWAGRVPLREGPNGPPVIRPVTKGAAEAHLMPTAPPPGPRVATFPAAPVTPNPPLARPLDAVP